MAALVLSLLIASANSSYDRQSSELKALSANIILLDRTLKLTAARAWPHVYLCWIGLWATASFGMKGRPVLFGYPQRESKFDLG